MLEDAEVRDIVEMRSGGALSRVFEEIVDNNKTVAGVPVSPETALMCGAVLSCVRVLAESVASIPFNVYRRLPGGGSEIAEGLPLQEVIAYQPNGWMTSFEFRELMESWKLLWGNAYAHIVSGSRGAVSELIPLHPSRMTVKRLENGRLRYYYREPNQATPVEFPQDEIFHIRWLSRDGVTGYVPTALSRDVIGLARATEIHAGAFFGNGARPGTVIEVDEPLKPETMQRLRQTWEDIHRGPDRAHKTAVMPHGTHVKELTSNNQTAQLVETMRYAVEAIARVYRVPAHLIGDLTNVRHSTVEQSAIDFITFSLMPHLRRWEMACRRDLIVDDKQYFCQFDVKALMAGDYAARSQFLREMFQMAALDVDELRAEIGLNPLPNNLGKKRFVQVNMQLLDAFTLETPNGQKSPEATGPTPGPPPPTPADAQERAAAEVLFKSTVRRLAAAEAAGIIERRNKPAKLEQWIDSCAERMRLELCDAAKATGRDVDEFVVSWKKTTNELLLSCHRSGKPYEEVTATWTDRMN